MAAGPKQTRVILGISELPPKVPQALDTLDRAIMLLGSRVKSPLRQKARHELLELIGAYPGANQAAIWKKSLKHVRKHHYKSNSSSDGSVSGG